MSACEQLQRVTSDLKISGCVAS